MTTQFNPLEPLATAARQLNEQANVPARGLGDTLTQATNTFLSVPGQLPLARPLPGNGNGTRGNSNGNPLNGAFPTLQQLVPTQALQPLTQVEDVIIPAGMPRPSRLLMDTFQLGTPTQEPMPTEEEPRRPAGALRVPGVEGTNGRVVTRALGVQAV